MVSRVEDAMAQTRPINCRKEQLRVSDRLMCGGFRTYAAARNAELWSADVITRVSYGLRQCWAISRKRHPTTRRTRISISFRDCRIDDSNCYVPPHNGHHRVGPTAPDCIWNLDETREGLSTVRVPREADW